VMYTGKKKSRNANGMMRANGTKEKKRRKNTGVFFFEKGGGKESLLMIEKKMNQDIVLGGVA